jgi:hypothetical protein
MNIRPTSLFPLPKVAALALAAGLVSLGVSSASAQFFRWPSWDAPLSPGRVERMIEASGYRLTGPVIRNGPVYLANVLGRGDDRERLVIDARDGRLLERSPAGALGRPPAFARDWSRPPRERTEEALLDSDEDGSPPRPPEVIYGGAGNTPWRLPPPDSGARPRTPQGDELARSDDSSGSPYVILAPPAAAREPALEKPRPKPQVRRKKPEPTPLAQPAATPADAKPTAVAQPPAANPTSNAAPPPQAASEPAPAPRVAETKTVAAPAAEVVPAATAAPPKPSKRAPNDVPVAPLE